MANPPSKRDSNLAAEGSRNLRPRDGSTPETPDADTENVASGNGTCKVCGAGPDVRPDRAGRCVNGHFMPGNRAAAITGEHGARFRDEHGAEIQTMADRFARDSGYQSFALAPLAFQVVAISLARTVKVADLAYWRMLEAGGPMSESGKPRRAYTVWNQTNTDLARDLKGVMGELVKAQPPSSDGEVLAVAGLSEASTPEEFIAELEREIEECEQAISAFRALASKPSALPKVTVGAQIPSLHSSPKFTPDAQTAPTPKPADRPSTPEPQPTEAPIEPTPVLYVYNHLVTADDVERCYADSGELADWKSGKVSKAEAYGVTANWLRNAMNFNG
jgi:hypothetical protein